MYKAAALSDFATRRSRAHGSRRLIALFATATVEPTAPALLGAALMSFGFWLKARFEEQFSEDRTWPGVLGGLLPACQCSSPS